LKIITLLFFSCILWTTILPSKVSAQQPNTIHIVSEEWDLLTASSGIGLYWDVLRAVYAEAGIKVKIDTTSYAQSVNKVINGQADAWLGSGLDEIEGAIYPMHHLDIDHISALVRSGEFAPWQGENSLTNRKVGWIKDYAYDEYLSVPVVISEFALRKVAFRHLAKGDIDAFVDAKYDIEQAAIEHNIDMSKFTLHSLLDEKIYIGFSDTDAGQKLRDLYDKGMEKLLKNGGLKKVFANYPQLEYPY
jgi:polar amino acid transport system substrate-binding protein